MTGGDQESASAALGEFRRRKDEHFASGRGPIRGDALRSFKGLSYYPGDPSLRFTLPVEPADAQEVTLQTSSGETRQMRAYGTVSVPFGEVLAVLTLYAAPGDAAPDSLFLPFRDAGSGSESYGAGRYLDIPLVVRSDQAWVTLDFNLAYHPYCAYGDGWTCPLPPAGNWLSHVLRAGERLP